MRPLRARAASSNTASNRVLERCGFAVTAYRESPADARFPACEEALLRIEKTARSSTRSPQPIDTV